MVGLFAQESIMDPLKYANVLAFDTLAALSVNTFKQ